jgi:hypothetical protein
MKIDLQRMGFNSRGESSFFVMCDDPKTSVICDSQEDTVCMVAKILNVDLPIQTAGIKEAQPETAGRTLAGVAPTTEQRNKICPECLGEGSDYDHHQRVDRRCSWCNGTGKLHPQSSVA